MRFSAYVYKILTPLHVGPEADRKAAAEHVDVLQRNCEVILLGFQFSIEGENSYAKVAEFHDKLPLMFLVPFSYRTKFILYMHICMTNWCK